MLGTDSVNTWSRPSPVARARRWYGSRPMQRDLALRQIGVDVPAVHRRRDEQRQAPTAAACGRAGCASCAGRPARSGRASAMPAPSSPRRWWSWSATPSGCGTAGSAAAPRTSDPAPPGERRRPSAPMAIKTVPVAPNSAGPPQRDQLGVVQRGADGPFVAVPSGNRRAEGPQAERHHSSVAAADMVPVTAKGTLALPGSGIPSQ